jgi:hypothetical protein
VDILDNELVRKYFGEDNKFFHEDIAVRVLRAMQEPIRKGERVLEFFVEPERWKDAIYVYDGVSLNQFHPMFMRLPDRFQTAEKKECKCTCHNVLKHKFHEYCDQPMPPNSNPPPAPLCDCVSGLGQPHPTHAPEKHFDDFAKHSEKKCACENLLCINGEWHKKPSDAGRCECYKVCIGHDHEKCIALENCKCKCHDSEKAVEAKIKEIMLTEDLEASQLRELVEIVRKEKI